ncbi:MAG: hypothetical protein R3243_16955 [Arenibacter latericius]|nr:hypothetical protein [Arenibacter latericius]
MKKKQRKQVIDYVVSNHDKIIVHPGVCRYNYKCHMNAVHDAISDGDDSLAMCIYIDDGYPVIHFINIHDGEYVDNTLGQWSSRYEYYLVKKISSDEFFEIESIFVKYRNYLKTIPDWWLRIFGTYIC